jgi:hypothetical protein
MVIPFFNSGTGVWSFSVFDTIKATFPNIETISTTKNTYWVSPTFPNTGKFYSSINAALAAAPSPNNDSNRILIVVYPGNYDGFTCSKSYVEILGVGKPIIDMNISTTRGSYVTGNKVKLKGLVFSDRRIPSLSSDVYTALDVTGEISIEECEIRYTAFTNTSINTPLEFNGIKCGSLGNVIIKNCSIDLNITYEPSVDPPEKIDLEVNSIKINTGSYEFKTMIDGLKLSTTGNTSSDFLDIVSIGINNYNSSPEKYWLTKVFNTDIFLLGGVGISINSNTLMILNNIFSNKSIDISAEGTSFYQFGVFIDSNFK